MTLLDEIVGLLSSSGSLETALLKTKILLHQIGHKELVAWVNDELNGYPDTVGIKDLPAYRIVSAQPHADVTYGDRTSPNYALPVYHLSEEHRNSISRLAFTSSVGTIEQQVKVYRENQHGLIRQLPPEFAALFQQELTPGTYVIKIWCAINMADVEAIVINVRSRLLDFALELQSVVGVNADLQQLVERAATVDTEQMFRSTVYHIHGGTTVIGATNVQVNNQNGDINRLLNEIAKLGYAHEDIEELRTAIAADKSNNLTPAVIDGETSKWYMKALKKAGKGTVDAGIELASKVIIGAIKNFSGS